MTALPSDPPLGKNKANVGAGTVVMAGAAMKLLTRAINYQWPGFLDPDTADAFDVLILGGLTWVAVYLTPHGAN